MDSMFSIIDLLIMACGAYVLYNYYLLKFKGEIKETLLLPKDVSAKKCKDKQAYITEISPKVLIYGIIVLVSGAAGIFEDKYQMLGNYYLIILAVFGIGTIWFAMAVKKAAEKYW